MSALPKMFYSNKIKLFFWNLVHFESDLGKSKAQDSVQTFYVSNAKQRQVENGRGAF